MNKDLEFGTLDPLPGYFLIEYFRRAPESWAGNYSIANDRRYPEANLVSVRLSRLLEGDYRVSVWGNDDLGMDRDFPADQLESAKTLYMDLSLVSVGNFTRKRLIKIHGLAYF